VKFNLRNFCILLLSASVFTYFVMALGIDPVFVQLIGPLVGAVTVLAFPLIELESDT
jgi:hypothetical protein